MSADPAIGWRARNKLFKAATNGIVSVAAPICWSTTVREPLKQAAGRLDCKSMPMAAKRQQLDGFFKTAQAVGGGPDQAAVESEA